MSRRYQIKEIFYSLQGEGVRAGIPHIFIRFAGCNLDCNDETMGWSCDTDFAGGQAYAPRGLLMRAASLADPECEWVLFTGGEPALQLDEELLAWCHADGWKVAVETNGTKALPDGIDWVCVSPKYEPVVLDRADEVKVVLVAGQRVPDLEIAADHYLISPAFGPCDHDGDCEPPACPGYHLDGDTLKWCVQLVLDNPGWRLSLQTHKFLGIR